MNLLEDYNKKNLNLWNKMFKVWESQNVPYIRLKKFNFEKHLDDEPWYIIEEKTQVLFNSRNEVQMAHLLARFMKEKNNLEISAALKIDAFLRNFYGRTKLQDPINIALQKQNFKISDFWYYNTRYVLPEINLNIYDIGYEVQEKDWEKIIKKAADVWKELADTYAIIIIPRFMNKASMEFKQFTEKKNKQKKEREYQHYLSLKAKFEGQN